MINTLKSALSRGKLRGRGVMWSSFGSAPPPDTTGGLVGIIESSTRYRWSAGTSQRPDRSRGKGWGRGCGLPAEACPGYALHNLCYTKLILALFRASVKFHRRILYEVPSFPICAFSRILEQFSQRSAPGASFRSRQCIHVNTLLSRLFSPLPWETTFRWWNYVEFEEVRVVWLWPFGAVWCWLV